MPTIANPQLHRSPSRVPRVPTPRSLTEAVGTRIHETTKRGAFTRDLAAGADPLASCSVRWKGLAYRPEASW